MRVADDTFQWNSKCEWVKVYFELEWVNTSAINPFMPYDFLDTALFYALRTHLEITDEHFKYFSKNSGQ